MTFTYTASIPQPGTFPSISQPQILNNFQYLNAFASVDHNFSGTNTGTDGMHNKVTFPVNAGAPAFAPGVSVLYADIASTVSALHLRNAAGSFAVTGLNPSIGATGFTCLPGGLVLQWGKVTINPIVIQTALITWATPFTTFFSCTFGVAYIGTGVAPADIQIINPSSYTTNITVLLGANLNTRDVYYMAIGTK